MPPRSAEQLPPSPPPPDYSFYASAHREALTDIQIAICDTTFETITEQLAPDLRPNMLKDGDQPRLAHSIHRLMRVQRLELLPEGMVDNYIEQYFTQWPPGTLDKVTRAHRDALQNRLIPIAEEQAKRHVAVTQVANFLVACQARKLPVASSAMYALLTVYGRVIEELPRWKGTEW